MCDLFESAPSFPYFFIMEDEEILSSSCSSADEQQELQGLLSTSKPSLNQSIEIIGFYTPPREDPPVEIFNPLIEETPEQEHVQQPDHASLDSAIDVMDDEDSAAQNSSDPVQDNAPSEYVERTPTINYDIDGLFEYEDTSVDGKPYVPPNLIPAYFTSSIRYGFCGRCTRARDFGYEDWLTLESSGDSETLKEIGNNFCHLCGLNCVTPGLLDKHVDTIHVLRGWFPSLIDCEDCCYPSRFPGPPTI